MASSGRTYIDSISKEVSINDIDLLLDYLKEGNETVIFNSQTNSIVKDENQSVPYDGGSKLVSLFNFDEGTNMAFNKNENGEYIAYPIKVMESTKMGEHIFPERLYFDLNDGVPVGNLTDDEGSLTQKLLKAAAEGENKSKNTSEMEGPVDDKKDTSEMEVPVDNKKDVSEMKFPVDNSNEWAKELNLKSLNLQYEENDAVDLKNDIDTLQENFNTIAGLFSSFIVEDFNEITNKFTKKKLQGTVDEGQLNSQINVQYLSSISNHFSEIFENLKNIINEAEAADKDGGTDIFPSKFPYKTTSNGSSSLGDGSEVTDLLISEVVTNENDVIPSLTIASAVGILVFKEIVTLYETIGSSTGIPSNINGNYLVLGIIKAGDKKYYKIIDKDTNKVYYVELSENVEFKTEMENVLEVKGDTFMLNSAEIGTNNFVKLADQNTMYTILNETENEDITFCNILDPVDGNSYYIPISDEVEKVSISSLGGVSNTSSEVNN